MILGLRSRAGVASPRTCGLSGQKIHRDSTRSARDRWFWLDAMDHHSSGSTNVEVIAYILRP
jgi:hypothetical protein